MEKYGAATPEALVESALGQAALLRRFDFEDVCISIKSSDVEGTVRAYRLLSKRTSCPLHIGVTEAGGEYMDL